MAADLSSRHCELCLQFTLLYLRCLSAVLLITASAMHCCRSNLSCCASKPGPYTVGMLSCAGTWDPLTYVQRSQDLTSKQVSTNLSTTITGKPIHEFMPRDTSKPKRGKRSRNDMYMLPVEYTSVKDGPRVCFCSSSLLEHLLSVCSG